MTDLQAFSDESYDRGRRLYVMSAVILNNTRFAGDKVVHELERIVAVPGHRTPPYLHAHLLSPDKLDAAESALVASDVVEAAIVVRAPVGSTNGDEERARQRCIADLAVSLSGQGVTRWIMDSRDDLTQRGPQQHRKNTIDIATLRDLVEAGEVSPQLRITHSDDKKVHRLWLADLVALAGMQSVRDDNPDRLRILASKVTIAEATVVPVRLRVQGVTREVTSLSPALERLGLLAQRLSADSAGRAIADDQLQQLHLRHQRIPGLDRIVHGHDQGRGR